MNEEATTMVQRFTPDELWKDAEWVKSFNYARDEDSPEFSAESYMRIAAMLRQAARDAAIVERLWYKVIVGGKMIAGFDFADQAHRWGQDNYNGQYSIETPNCLAARAAAEAAARKETP